MLRGRFCSSCYFCPFCGEKRTNGKPCNVCKTRFYKTKEMQTVRFLTKHFPKHELIHNRSVGKDCTDTNTLRFPDILYICFQFDLIVEVDERKHIGVNYKCDKKRMYEIYAMCGRPTIFIRYNPDSKNSDLNVLVERVKHYLKIGNLDYEGKNIHPDDLKNAPVNEQEQEDEDNSDENYLIKTPIFIDDNDNDDEIEPTTQEEIDHTWNKYGFKVEYLFY